MESNYSIFLATLKENKSHPNFFTFVKDLSFEFAYKKIQKLEDEQAINEKLCELFTLYGQALEEEGLKSHRALNYVIEGLLKAASYNQELYLYKMMYEKEQLEKNIFNQKQSIRHTIANAFSTFEQHAQTLPEHTREKAIQALHDAQLRGIEILGILRETTQEALITTLEKAHDIKDTIHEITRNLSFEVIDGRVLTKQHILDVARTITEASMEIADEDLANAKAILEGSIFGIKDGIAKAIDKFKNDLKFSPTEELENLKEHDLSVLHKDLARIEEYLMDQLKVIATQSDGISEQIITDMLIQMNTSKAKIKRASNEAKEVIAERIDKIKAEAEVKLSGLKQNISELEKIASTKLESLKQFDNEKAKQMATEAKKLGFRAWEVAKSMMENTIKNTKDTPKKDDK